MRFVVDTQILVWLMSQSIRLPANVRDWLTADDSVVHFSIATIWEIAIKSSLGKLALDAEAVARQAEEDGFVRLDLTIGHMGVVQRLPWHHRDPFDRILVAQSLAEPMTLLTTDRRLARYGSTVRVV